MFYIYNKPIIIHIVLEVKLMVEFCDRCDSFMEASRGGFECPRCGWTKKADIIEVKSGPENEPEPAIAPDIVPIVASEFDISSTSPCVDVTVEPATTESSLFPMLLVATAAPTPALPP